MGIKVVARGKTNVQYHLSVQPTLIDIIKIVQKEDFKLMKVVEEVKSGHSNFRVADDGVLQLQQ